MIDLVFLIGTLALSAYFFFKLKTQPTHKGFHGFAAGVFLIIFIYKAAPVFAKLYLSML
jgi:hypothetical protein